MAYDATVAYPRLSEQIPGAGRRIWSYESADTAATVDTSGYFTDGYNRGMRDGDLLRVYVTGTKVWTMHTITVSGTTVNVADGTSVGIATNTD